VLSDLIANADLAKQAMPGTPDGWLLFPTTGTPPGGMDLDAVLLADPAAARRGSNTTAALRVVLSDPRGTGIHLPALDSGLDASARYSLSFWGRTNAVTSAGILTLARSPRPWHYVTSKASAFCA
jgi:hypothetical protein